MRLIDADKVNPEDVFIGASDFVKDCRAAVIELMNKQPTVDAEIKKNGKWVQYEREAFYGSDPDGNPIFVNKKYFKHDECGRKTVIKERFCPNCGAKMD